MYNVLLERASSPFGPRGHKVFQEQYVPIVVLQDKPLGSSL